MSVQHFARRRGRALHPVVVAVVAGFVVAGVVAAMVAAVSDDLRSDGWLLFAGGAAAAVLGALLVPEGRGSRDLVVRAPVVPADPDAPGSVSDTPVRLTTLGSASVPKLGSSADENDDAFAVDTLGRAAVADGASSSYDAGRWARHLVERWAADPAAVTAADVAAWAVRCAASYTGASTSTDGASWWSAEAAGQAAHATFVGLDVQRSPSGLVWRAVAVGDAAVVHLRAKGAQLRLVSAFPYEASGGASGAPLLLASDASDARAVPSIRVVEGPAEAGDVWLLATDEVARWALAANEAGAPLWSMLVAAGAPFEAAVAGARADATVVNDDMTAVAVTVAEA